MRVWLVFIIGGIGTYLTRVSFFALGTRVTLPAWSDRLLKYVAPAVFAAIVVPPILGENGVSGAVTTVNPRLLAAGAAALVGYRSRNIALVLVVGMCSLWLLQLAGL